MTKSHSPLLNSSHIPTIHIYIYGPQRWTPPPSPGFGNPIEVEFPFQAILFAECLPIYIYIYINQANLAYCMVVEDYVVSRFFPKTSFLTFPVILDRIGTKERQLKWGYNVSIL